MRKLLWVLAILLSPALSHSQCTVSSGATTAQIQTAVNQMAAGTCASPLTHQLNFGAGSYSITLQVNIPCPTAASIMQGPVQDTTTWPITPTAILTNAGMVNTAGFRTTACSNPLTMQFLQYNGANPSSGGGAIYVTPGTNNLTIQYNWFYGVSAQQTASNIADTIIWMDGSDVAGSTHTQNTTIRLNRLGTPNSNDCAALMNVIGGPYKSTSPFGVCTQSGSLTFTPPGGGTTVPAGYNGGGNAMCLYQDGDVEKSAGGYCGGVGVHVMTDNLNISNNSFAHLEQGIKYFEGCGNQTCANQFYTTNQIANANDFTQTHRITIETQQTLRGAPFQLTNISMHDEILFGGVSWGISAPQSSLTSDPQVATLINNNLLIDNSAHGTDKNGYGAARSYGVEFWGYGAQSFNNLIQGVWGGSYAWGFGGSNGGAFWNISNNNMQQATTLFEGYITNEEGATNPPTQVGNLTSHTIAATTSVAPTISPSSGSAPLTVTLTDPGYTSGSLPLGNTGIWYTTDNSTPVPGTGTAKYLSSGGSFTMTNPGTVKAVGMWGAINQPTSYPSGYGFVPSAQVSATFTSGPCGANNTLLITTFGGAVGDGTTDNTTAIQNTFNAAHTNGCLVEIPAAASSFAYSNVLTMNGITVFGIGPQSILKATNASNSAVKLTGTAPSLSNVVLLGTGSSRNTGPNQSEVWVSSATGYLVNNVLINGGSCTGIWDQSGSTGTETNNTVENTLADSITNTNGANQILIQNNLVIHSGDDGISNNSYTTDGNTVNHITVNQNAILRNAFGRGLEVSGGSNISFTNNYVNNAIGLADLILTSETSSFQTQAVNTVTVSGNTLVQGGSNSQGDLFLWPDGASNSLLNLTINNNRFQVNNTFTAVQTTGAGTISSSTLSNSQAYVTPNAAFFSGSSTGITQTANTSSATSAFPGPLNPIVAGTVPLFSLPGGTYALPQTLTLSEITSGDSIQWCTVGGAGPCTPATTYTGSITISTPQTICATGTNSSSVTPVVSATVCATYNPSPAATLVSGQQSNAGNVNTLNVGASAVQQIAVGNYSDGSQHNLPFGSDTAVWSSSSSSVLQVTSTGLVSCLAPNVGVVSSLVQSAPSGIHFSQWDWTCNAVPAATPTFSPGSESFTGTVAVTISTTTPSATINYTTDGSTPTTSSPTYSGPITVNATTTIRAIANASGFMQSAVGSATYTLLVQTATPTFNPVSGTVFGTSLSVSIADSTVGASIFYTTDGSTPTTSSTLYTGAFTITTSTTVKAIATASGFTQSAVGTASYTAGTNVVVAVSMAVLGNLNYVLVGGSAQFAAIFTYADATQTTNTTVGVNDARGNHITAWQLTSRGGTGTISNSGMFTGSTLGSVQVNSTQTGAVSLSTPWFEYVSQSITNRAAGVSLDGVTIP